MGEVDRSENFTPIITGVFDATVECSNASGTTASTSSVTVVENIGPPVVAANYNPGFLSVPGFSFLSWVSSGANFCRIPSVFGNFAVGASGGTSRFITNSIFTQVLCTGTGGTASGFAFVGVANNRNSGQTEGTSETVNHPAMMSVSDDFNRSGFEPDIDWQIDKVLLSALGAKNINGELNSLAIDLNNDGLNDRLIFSVEQQMLYVLISDNGAFIKLNKTVNNVSDIQDIASISVSQDGIVKVQVIQ